jgi:spore coat protein A, manganese oxidase
VILSRRRVLQSAAQLGAALAAGSAWADPLPLRICSANPLRKAVMRSPESAPPSMLHPERLAPFVDELPTLKIARSQESAADPEHPGQKIPLYRIGMHEAQVRIHRDVPPTRMWGYDGVVPGPTFDVRAGHPLLIEWSNELPTRHFLPIDHTLHGAGAGVPESRAVVHVHGARVRPDADGYPDSWFTPGNKRTYRYPMRQQSATLWYHDHAMGIERLNVYAGLFGAFLIRDELEDGLGLPRDEFEVPLIIADRQFNADGRLYYPTSGMPDSPWVSEAYGDVILVNGKMTPYLNVEPRAYRFRIVNASNARFYYLAFSDGTLLQQIGSDQGLLPQAVAMKAVTLAPAERADVVVDFSKLAGQSVVLRSLAMDLMQFKVMARKAAVANPLPKTLRPAARLSPANSVKTRRLTLDNYEDPNTHMMMMLLNATYWRQPITENPVLNTTEIWEFVNLTDDTHPIHLHMVRFQVLNRQRFDVDEYLMSGKMIFAGPLIPPLANEYGWKDTVRADAGLMTRIIIPFEGYPGRYVWHCHVLEHAANEMMRPFQVLPPSTQPRTSV